MSALDETLMRLDLTGIPCTVSRRSGEAAITSHMGMQVVVREVDGQLVEVLYERALHEAASEQCEPAMAAAFVRLVLSRKRLEPIALPRG
jgi:hypothetical protein